MRAIRAGHTYSVITAIAAPATLVFTATAGTTVANMGDRIEGPLGVETAFHAEVPEAPFARVTLVHHGRTIASGRGQVAYSGSLDAGVYRVEVYYPGRDVPWIVSNPIYAGPPTNGPPGPRNVVPRPPPLRLVPLPAPSGWTIEHSGTSSGVCLAGPPAPPPGGCRFAFVLGGGEPAGQYAALVSSLDDELRHQGYDRVQFTISADRPMRFDVQIRLPGGGSDGRRWRRSIYVDQTPRPLVLPLDTFEPVGRPTSTRPVVAHLNAVLFVVDTMNTPPGARGTITVANAALGVGSVAPPAPTSGR